MRSDPYPSIAIFLAVRFELSGPMAHTAKQVRFGSAFRAMIVRTSPHPDYTHIAMSVAESEFVGMRDGLMADCKIWKDIRSEGALVYFLDPNGHKLELHVDDLETKLRHYKDNPSPGVRVYEQ